LERALYSQQVEMVSLYGNLVKRKETFHFFSFQLLPLVRELLPAPFTLSQRPDTVYTYIYLCILASDCILYILHFACKKEEEEEEEKKGKGE
jgi:hypothetical protein